MDRRLIIFAFALLVCLSFPAFADDTDAAAVEEGAGEHSLSGQVLDAEGEPVVGATVHAGIDIRARNKADKQRGKASGTKPAKRKVPPFEPLSATTGEDGSFEIGGLNAGPYVVRVEAEGFALWTDNEIDGAEALEVRMAPGHSLSGVIRDNGEGSAIAGASIRACDKNSHLFGTEFCHFTESDGEGRFRFEDLAESAHDLILLATGHEGMQRLKIAVPQPEDAAPVEFLLAPGADLEVTVVDAGGAPVEDAWVSVTTNDFNRRVRLEGSRQNHYVDQPRSNADGISRQRGLTRGLDYTLYVRKKGYGKFEAAIPAFEEGEVERDFRAVLAAGALVRFRLVDGDDVAIEEPDVFLSVAREDAGPVARLNWKDTVTVVKDKIEALGDGSYEATDLPTGSYDVWLGATRYLSKIRKGVNLAPGEVRDLGKVTLEPGLEVHGTVTVNDGEPVGEGAVNVRWSADGRLYRRDATINEDGGFHAWGVDPESKITVNVVTKDCSDYRQTGITAEDLPLKIKLDRAAEIVGTVVDPDGAAVSGATAQIYASGAPVIAGRSIARATSEEDGSFRMRKVDPGNYSLEVRSSDYAPLRRPGIEIAAGDRHDAGKLELEPGLEVRGIVLSKRDGQPLGGATVTFSQQGMFSFNFGGAQQGVPTGVDGRFTYRGLGPGAIVVTGQHPDYAPTRKNLRLSEDSGITELELILEQGGRIVGTVTDAQGQPLANVNVMAMMGMGQSMIGPVETDASGRYVMDKVTAGVYTVTKVSQNDGAVAPRTKRAVVVEGEDVVVDFSDAEGIEVTGVVTRQGEPLGSAVVVLMPEGASNMDMSSFRYGQADENGNYKLMVDSPGTYRIMVQAGGQQFMGAGVGLRLEVPDGVDAMTRDIELEEGGGIAGTVTDADGNPLAEARVSAFPASDTQMTQLASNASTDASGAYRLTGLDEGEYRVIAGAEGYVFETRIGIRVDGAGETSGVDFALDSGRPVRVEVRGGGGNPVSMAMLSLTMPGDVTSVLGDGFTNHRGIAMVDLPEGQPFDLYVVAQGWAPGNFESVVPQGDEEPYVQVTLQEGATLQLQLTDASGAPVAGRRVRLQGDSLPRGIEMLLQMMGGGAATSNDGIALLPNLLPGNYRVFVDDNAEPIGSVVVTEGGENTYQLTVP
ncbi:hypothetical protein ABI59_10215 [Acidobacteria bacterium Mor1]|nr:hypothetical protein ABI59_10215 [Acidobacteria bacterium Mor1]